MSSTSPPLVEQEPVAGSYFVSTYPPFSTWDGEGAEAYRRTLERPGDPGRPLGLYVHVPFCVERCRYCYYLSHDDRPEAAPLYLGALEAELAIHRERPAFSGRSLGFLYVGGGTPSTLPGRDLARLLQAVGDFRPREPGAEFTVECAPRTVTGGKLTVLRDGGVTRISLGVQQLDDDVLRANGRIHLIRDVERAWDEILRHDFPVVNVDLMVGMLGETEERFHRSLDRVIAMGPDCVTLYQMEVPHNTPVYLDLQRETLPAPLPSWEDKRRRLGGAFARLEAEGYQVRSAYALVRDPARHRFVYQDAQYRGADLLGVGASAFSYVSGVHHQNLASLGAYREALRGRRLPSWRGRALNREERMRRELLLRLKLGRVERDAFADRFGVDPAVRFRSELGTLAREGWLRIDPHAIRLTRAGLLRVDRLLPRLYLPEHQGIRYS